MPTERGHKSQNKLAIPKDISHSLGYLFFKGNLSHIYGFVLFYGYFPFLADISRPVGCNYVKCRMSVECKDAKYAKYGGRLIRQHVEPTGSMKV